jgi:coenzyme F420-0:L-glutamate ligase / coenzyme F420-1:gamma-L-glutamate ligase
MAAPTVTLIAVPDIPLIEPDDDLPNVLIDALRNARIELQARDVVVVAQKIVSKAENRYLELSEVEPSPRALEIAGRLQKDPRHVEAILRESREVVRERTGLLITEHRLGYVMANAGIDQSNVAQANGSNRVLLLPQDPDGFCNMLKHKLDAAFGTEVAVVMNDSFGRPLRNGVVGVALGAAGLPCLVNLVGTKDLFGRTLEVTEVAFADEIASAASMLMGQAGEGLPVIVIRGLRWHAPEGRAADLIRPKQRDLFR